MTPGVRVCMFCEEGNEPNEVGWRAADVRLRSPAVSELRHVGDVCPRCAEKSVTFRLVPYEPRAPSNGHGS